MEVAEPVSPSYRSRVREVERTYRSHAVAEVPELHTGKSQIRATFAPRTGLGGLPPWAHTSSDQHVCCGDDRTRTGDPLLAKQVLYQLSYVPAP